MRPVCGLKHTFKSGLQSVLSCFLVDSICMHYVPVFFFFFVFVQSSHVYMFVGDLQIRWIKSESSISGFHRQREEQSGLRDRTFSQD